MKLLLTILLIGLLTPITLVGQVTFSILHNNDGESQLIHAPGQTAFGGVARFKRVADSLKAAAATAGHIPIMVSSGDNFLAGTRFNASLVRPANEPIYDAVAMDRIGYDAVAIGNHDFDFGPDVLQRFITSFSMNATPFLSANLGFEQEAGLLALQQSGRIAKSTVVTRQGESIGIIGATTPVLPFISSPRNTTVSSDVVAAVQAQVDALTAQGIQRIVLISHLQSIVEDSILATQLRGVDVMVAGGGDELLANPGTALVPGDAAPKRSYPIYAKDADGNDVPIVTTAGDYKYVGRLVVTFDAQGRVSAVNQAASGPFRVTGAEDADMRTAVTVPVQSYLDALNQTVVATSTVPLDGTRTGVRGRETNLGNLVADAYLWEARGRAASFQVKPADVALTNGGGIRNNTVIPAGNLTELATFDILPFANFLSVLEDVPAQQFVEILENAVSRVANGDGRFAQIAGFRMVYDPTAQAQVLDAQVAVTTPGRRIVSVVLEDGREIVRNGQLVPNAPSVTIATVDFLAKNGDQYPFRGHPFTTLGVTYQQVLYRYLTMALNGTVTDAAYPEGGTGRITTGSVVSVDAQELPVGTVLHAAYPNPFNPSTEIRWTLDAGRQTRLSVHDVLGREVAVLVDAAMPAGSHAIRFDARHLSSGVYIVRLATENGLQTTRMTLMK